MTNFSIPLSPCTHMYTYRVPPLFIRDFINVIPLSFAFAPLSKFAFHVNLLATTQGYNSCNREERILYTQNLYDKIALHDYTCILIMIDFNIDLLKPHVNNVKHARVVA